MKRLLSYALLILVLYAFNYKTINLCVKYADHSSSSVCVQDYDCNKEDCEKSDEKNEKDEKKDLSEYSSFYRPHAIILHHQLAFIQQAKLLFVPSDYSKAVYCPPEQSVI